MHDQSPSCSWLQKDTHSAVNGNAMQRTLGILRVCPDDLLLEIINYVDGVATDMLHVI